MDALRGPPFVIARGQTKSDRLRDLKNELSPDCHHDERSDEAIHLKLR